MGTMIGSWRALQIAEQGAHLGLVQTMVGADLPVAGHSGEGVVDAVLDRIQTGTTFQLLRELPKQRHPIDIAQESRLRLEDETIFSELVGRKTEGFQGVQTGTQPRGLAFRQLKAHRMEQTLLRQGTGEMGSPQLFETDPLVRRMLVDQEQGSGGLAQQVGRLELADQAQFGEGQRADLGGLGR